MRGALTGRRRSAGGDRCSSGVCDHHRIAQQDSPETAAIPFAKRPGLLEVLLGACYLSSRAQPLRQGKWIRGHQHARVIEATLSVILAFSPLSLQIPRSRDPSFA
jgi:hypothetical protein